MKRIKDTVHGHILIEEKYFEFFIDTPNFQRLRHIDQSAIRSIYPCARHDRFIHSLGVFHLGSLVVEHLKKVLPEEVVENLANEFTSYLIACLLHDVGHAPFSHTFEKYFGIKEELAKKLNEIIRIVDEGKERETNYHEYTSAIVALKVYGEKIEKMGGDCELVARMITGQRYSDDSKSLENCLIELLHGDIVDVDRMDYTCRDVWASGYSTSRFDVTRLINSIILKVNETTGIWQIHFLPSAITEIEGMLKVREFQNRYVIGHHTVVYDQNLLVKAVENSIRRQYEISEGEEPISKICTIDNLTDEGIEYKFLSDSDLISLMKRDNDNEYFKEWFSRCYVHIPIWKTITEFNHYFPFLKGFSIKAEFEDIFNDVMSELKITDYLIYRSDIKGDVDLSKLNLLINNKSSLATDIYEFYRNNPQPDKKFFYTYINKKDQNKRDQVIAELYTRLEKAQKHY